METRLFVHVVGVRQDCSHDSSRLSTILEILSASFEARKLLLFDLLLTMLT